MKFIYITCNVSMLETLTLLLNEMEYADYQVIEQVTAMSRWGGTPAKYRRMAGLQLCHYCAGG